MNAWSTLMQLFDEELIDERHNAPNCMASCVRRRAQGVKAVRECVAGDGLAVFQSFPVCRWRRVAG